MFNVKEFRKQQDAGLVSLFRTGTKSDTDDATTYAVVQSRFDPVTGKQIESEVFGVTHKALVERRDSLQADLDALNAFLDEVEALEPDQFLAAKASADVGEVRT